MTPANSSNSRAEPGTAEAADAEVISRVRIDRLRRSMPGKKSVIGEMIDLFVADLPVWLGEICEAIDRADARGLALQAHALRGSAGNFGAARLDDLCGALEELGAGGALAGARAMLDRAARRRRARTRRAARAQVQTYWRGAGRRPGGSEIHRQLEKAVIDKVAMLEQNRRRGPLDVRIGVGVHAPKRRRQRT